MRDLKGEAVTYPVDGPVTDWLTMCPHAKGWQDHIAGVCRRLVHDLGVDKVVYTFFNTGDSVENERVLAVDHMADTHYVDLLSCPLQDPRVKLLKADRAGNDVEVDLISEAVPVAGRFEFDLPTGETLADHTIQVSEGGVLIDEESLQRQH